MTTPTEISEHHKPDGLTTLLTGAPIPNRTYHYSLKIEDVDGMHDAIMSREEAKVLIEELTKFITVPENYPFDA